MQENLFYTDKGKQRINDALAGTVSKPVTSKSDPSPKADTPDPAPASKKKQSRPTASLSQERPDKNANYTVNGV